MKKYSLYSAVNRCPPCRQLVVALDREFPEWENFVEHVNVDKYSRGFIESIQKIGVHSLPSFTDYKKVLVQGFSPDKLKQIIDYAKG